MKKLNIFEMKKDDQTIKMNPFFWLNGKEMAQYKHCKGNFIRTSKSKIKYLIFTYHFKYALV